MTTRRHSFWCSLGKFRGGRTAILVLTGAAILSFPAVSACIEETVPQSSGVATVEGTIRDNSGKPIDDVAVILQEKKTQARIETKTNPAGAFLLSLDQAGTYTVRAEKSGWRDAVIVSLALSIGDRKHVDLVLIATGSQTPNPVAPTSETATPMEFKDDPSFTVAGVTDWSNLGLHGSSASSRTSESLARETLSLKPGEAEAAHASKQYEVALSYSAKGEYAKARDEVRKALRTADNAEGHRLLGELDERLHDPLEAVREYELTARMDPSEQNYFDWGSELLLHKAAEPAAEVFTRGSKAHPKSARMLTGLGAALYSSGLLEEAAKRLCEASDLQPSDPAPYLFLGQIEQTSSAPLPCSEQNLARFLEKQPENALANFYYAISLWKREKGGGNSAGSRDVETLLEKAAAIDPGFGEAYLQLGVLHFAHGDLERATRELQKAITVNPHLAEGHRQLGLVFERTGEKAKAQQEFRAYEQMEKIDAAERERQQKELRQFLIILKDQPARSTPD